MSRVQLVGAEDLIVTFSPLKPDVTRKIPGPFALSQTISMATACNHSTRIAVLGRGALSYERGTPVSLKWPVGAFTEAASHVRVPRPRQVLGPDVRACAPTGHLRDTGVPRS